MIRMLINGKRRQYRGLPFKRLLDVLREDFGLTGTKEGCGEGECGACTVLVDGHPVNSCLVPVCQMEGRGIETVESLGSPERLNPLQEAFLSDGGAQCGICTPGMLMTAWAWVRDGGSAKPEAIRNQLAGNLCRCTGYQHIISSVVRTIVGLSKQRRRTGRALQAAAGDRGRGRGGEGGGSRGTRASAGKASRRKATGRASRRRSSR
jgi:carbon-monoxide dehydrogenase small subunit